MMVASRGAKASRHPPWISQTEKARGRPKGRQQLVENAGHTASCLQNVMPKLVGRRLPLVDNESGSATASSNTQLLVDLLNYKLH